MKIERYTGGMQNCLRNAKLFNCLVMKIHLEFFGKFLRDCRHGCLRCCSYRMHGRCLLRKSESEREIK